MLMSKVQLMLLEPRPKSRLHLRRVVGLGKEPYFRTCHTRPNGYGYHHADVPIIELNTPPDSSTMEFGPFPEGDPRWPQRCAGCYYEFQEDDEWFVYAKPLWVTPGGELISLDDAPIGSVWHASWMSRANPGEPGSVWNGPDGLCLVVKTPVGEWWLDGPSGEGNRWSRTVDGISTLTVNPDMVVRGQRVQLINGYLLISTV